MILGLLLAAVCGSVFAGDAKVEVLRPPPGERIEGLEWSADEAEAVTKPHGDGTEVRVTLEGRFVRDGWALMDGYAVVPFAEDGSFQLDVPVASRVQEHALYAVGPTGEIQSEKVILRLPVLETVHAQAAARPVKRQFMMPSLGFTSLSYRETGVVDLDEILLTGKFQFQYLLFPPNWDLAGNIYMNLVPLSTSVSNVSVKFLGANLRFGYSFPFIPQPWKVSFLVGGYYTQSIVSNGTFGYKPIVYPHFFPVVRRSLANRDSIFAYFKYVPLDLGLAFSLGPEREMATGVGWTRPLTDGRLLSLALDYADMRFKIKPTRESVTTSITLSFGYGW